MKTTHLFAGLLCLLLVLPAAADNADELRKLASLKKAISSLQKELSDKGAEKNKLVAELGAVEIEAAALNKSVRQLQDKIVLLDNELSKLDGEKKALELSIREQSKAIAEQVATAYRLGQQEPMKLLLNQEDPQRLSRVFRYYDYFLRQRTVKIDAYTADVAKLADLVTEISAQKLTLNQSKQKLVEQQQAVLASQQQRQSTLDKLNASLKSDQQKLSKLSGERSALEKLLSAVEEAINDLKIPNDYKPFAKRKGALPWPLKGRVRASFGSSRGGSLRWDGWLIQARAGEPVKAVHHGRVVFADYLRGFGLLSIVDHGDDYMTLYAHNQELLKEVGDWVLNGETLAYAGNSGGRDESALYFEIRRKGQPSDPKQWLVRR